MTTSGLTLLIISSNGSLLALMLWQLTFRTFKLGFPFTDLSLGTFSGDEICSGSPGEPMEPSQEKMLRSSVSSGCLGVTNWIWRMPCSIVHSYSRAIWMIPVRVCCIQGCSCPCMICATIAHTPHTVVHHMEILCHFSIVVGPGLLSTFPANSMIVCSIGMV